MDPCPYISHARHNFEFCYVDKSNPKTDIDGICKRYDMVLDYMVGGTKTEKEDATDHCG